MARIGPHSTPEMLAKVDGRTREARLMRRVAANLRAHVGGSPSAVQEQLIQRAAMLTLHVALFDRRALEGDGLSERDSRSYLAYANGLARILKLLGLKSADSRQPNIREMLARPGSALGGKP
jgi:hypothetical protein